MDERKQIELAANHEWRFKVPFSSQIVVTLLDGKAELFGTELALGRDYEFSGRHFAIYTYQGCKIRYSGSEVVEEVAKNQVMPVHASIHFALQTIRSQNTERGPVSLIVGSPKSGKTSLCKLLCSYAVKLGSSPMFVNLDSSNPVIIPPGALSASVISHVLDIEDGWGASPITGPAPYHPQQPFVLNFGLQSCTVSPVYYGYLLSRLAKEIELRLQDDETVRRSGVIIDTPSDFTRDLLNQAIREFKVDSIIVIDDEKLHSELHAAHPELTVTEAPRSSGVTDDDDVFHRQVQRQAIAQYYFGNPRQPLSPFTVTERLFNLTVYRILEVTEMPIPPGADAARNDGQSGRFLTKIEPSAILQNCVLAVANAKHSDDADVVSSAEIIGFVHVVEADEKKKSVRLLLPVPGRAPDRPLIMGAFQYHE